MSKEIEYYESKMKKSLAALDEEYNTIRAGRANPHVLDKITVDYWGVETPLNQVGNITVPEPRLIQIQPWEKKMLKEIEKSINMAKAMEVPMVGLVENMSYVICDDCGKKIYPFGHNDNAKDFGIDTIVELPINADFARACDNGQLEMIEVKELEPLIASIEKL